MNYNSFAVLLYVTDTEDEAVRGMYNWKPYRPKGASFSCIRTTVRKDGFTWPVYGVRLDEKGSTAAASMANQVLALFRPQYLIMPGIAAGVRFTHKAVQSKEGDVVLADSAWHISQGKYTTEEKGQIDAVKDVGFIPRPKVHGIDTSLRHILKDIVKTFSGNFKIHMGRYACGDSVVANAKIINEKVIPIIDKTKAFDMESYGVMYSATKFSRPKADPIIVKGISDFADSRKSDDAQKMAAENSCRFTKFLIDKLPVKELSIISFITNRYFGEKSGKYDYTIPNTMMRYEIMILTGCLILMTLVFGVIGGGVSGTFQWYSLYIFPSVTVLLSIAVVYALGKVNNNNPHLRYWYTFWVMLQIIVICLIKGKGAILVALPLFSSIVYLNPLFSTVIGIVWMAIQMLMIVLQYILFIHDGIGQFDFKACLLDSLLPVVLANIILILMVKMLAFRLSLTINRLAKDIVDTDEHQRDIKMIRWIRNKKKIWADKLQSSEQNIFGLVVDNGSLSGDFYDYQYDRNSSNVCLSVANGTLKGLANCYLLDRINTMIHDQTSLTDDLGRIAGNINQYVVLENSDHFSVNLTLGMLSFERMAFRYINTGSFIHFIRHADGTVERLPVTDSVRIGVEQEHDFDTREVRVRHGDMILFCTSGLWQSRNVDGEAFGVKRLELLFAACRMKSLRKICYAIKSEVEDYCNHSPSLGDFAMMVVKIPDNG